MSDVRRYLPLSPQQFHILLALTDGHRHGYGIIQEVAGRTEGAVRLGTGTSTSAPAWFRAGLGAPAADSVVTRPGVSYTGTLQHYFHVDLTAADLVDGYLPPSAANPWFLSVKEGGFLNTKGTVNDFSVTWFGPNGAITSVTEMLSQ